VKAYNTDWNKPVAERRGRVDARRAGRVPRRAAGRAGRYGAGGEASRGPYSRNGMKRFHRAGPAANPGVSIDASRNAAARNLGPLPLLSATPAGLGPAAVRRDTVYPMKDVITGDVNIFDPALQVPVRGFIHRRNPALDWPHDGGGGSVIGTRGRDIWLNLNYNEINLFENGFLNEFTAAQANLQANVASGRGGTSSTRLRARHVAAASMLPTSPARQAAAGNPAHYTSGPTFLQHHVSHGLPTYNPNPSASPAISTQPTLRTSLHSRPAANFFHHEPRPAGRGHPDREPERDELQRLCSSSCGGAMRGLPVPGELWRSQDDDVAWGDVPKTNLGARTSGRPATSRRS